jgi:hypothetical protein
MNWLNMKWLNIPLPLIGIWGIIVISLIFSWFGRLFDRVVNASKALERIADALDRAYPKTK